MENGSAMFQIWLDPNLGKTLEMPASYDDYKSSDFPVSEQNGISIKTYIGENSPFQLEAEGMGIKELSIGKGTFEYTLDENEIHSLYLLKGTLKIDEKDVAQDDFIKIIDVPKIKIESEGNATIFMISSPKDVLYKTYAELMQERMYR